MTSDGFDHQPSTGGPDGGIAKLDLDAIRARDVISMQTADGVAYRIVVGADRRAIFLASDEHPPAKRIILTGGTNADSSEFTPNRIYVGGRLAYAFTEADEAIFTTPVIVSMAWDRAPV